MAKTASAQAQVEKVVDGVLMGKVDAKVLGKHLREAGLQEETGGLDLGGKVNALQQKNRRTVPDVNKLECAICGGISDARLDECPFCGDTTEGGPKADAPKDLDKARADEAATDVRNKALAVKSDGEKKLDAQMAEVRRLKGAAAVGYWQLGHKIKEIFESETWRERRSAAGKSRYASFEQLCVNEIKMSSSTCYMMMDISKNFTEAQVKEFGATKLGLVLKAPPAEQPAVLEQVEQGATKRDLAQTVTDLKKKHGHTKRVTGRKVMPDANMGKAGKVAKPRADGKITVAVVEGSVRLNMYVKPDKKLPPGQLPEKLAKQVGDAPIAFEELQSGVFRYYSVIRAPDGHLVLKVETVRHEKG